MQWRFLGDTPKILTSSFKSFWNSGKVFCRYPKRFCLDLQKVSGVQEKKIRDVPTEFVGIFQKFQEFKHKVFGDFTRDFLRIFQKFLWRYLTRQGQRFSGFCQSFLGSGQRFLGSCYFCQISKMLIKPSYKQEQSKVLLFLHKEHLSSCDRFFPVGS